MWNDLALTFLALDRVALTFTIELCFFGEESLVGLFLVVSLVFIGLILGVTCKTEIEKPSRLTSSPSF
jgi:hypothetical protein